MPPTQFGYVVPVQGLGENGKPRLLNEEPGVLEAVASRLGSAWVYDHFYGFSHPQAAYLECWTTLTWLAARYPTLTVGSIVLGVGYRNPALVAKMGATLQTLSQGRFVLGLGAGWRAEEYQAYGFPYPAAPQRIQELEEAVIVIRRMWTETAPTFAGRHVQIESAYCPPSPEPVPPILIGAAGEGLMLPLVGRQADWWNVGNLPSLDDFRRKRDIVREAAAQAGRDPASIRLTYQVSERSWPTRAAEDQEWIDFLSPLVELGFSYFMLDNGPAGSAEVIERFASQVAGRL